MKFSKCVVVTLNIIFLVVSMILISVAVTPRFIFGDYYYILIENNDIGSLNSIWIAGAFVLMAVSIFGLCSALKESPFLMNLYTVILCFVFILQIVTAITSNTLTEKLQGIVGNSISKLMVNYGDVKEYTAIMDAIQRRYKCCGKNRPSDWYNNDQFSTTTKPKDRYTTQTETTWNEEVDNDRYEGQRAIEANILANLRYEIPDEAAEEDLMIIMPDIKKDSNEGMSFPSSCCTKKCKSYYTRGCFIPLYEDAYRSIFTVASLAMVCSIAQIVGILAAYKFGKTLKQKTVSRVIQIQR